MDPKRFERYLLEIQACEDLITHRMPLAEFLAGSSSVEGVALPKGLRPLGTDRLQTIAFRRVMELAVLASGHEVAAVRKAARERIRAVGKVISSWGSRGPGRLEPSYVEKERAARAAVVYLAAKAHANKTEAPFGAKQVRAAIAREHGISGELLDRALEFASPFAENVRKGPRVKAGDILMRFIDESHDPIRQLVRNIDQKQKQARSDKRH